MNLIHKLCAKLRHPFRQKIAAEITLDKNLSCTRFYICPVCGKTIREEK